MLHFVLGTAGSGKTWYTRNLIANKVEKGERGILLLVPEQNNYESERAMLRLLGSASSDVVEVTSFTLLSRNISALCGTDALRTADDGIKLLMMSRAIRQAAPQLEVFGKAGAARELCEKLLDFYTEIKRSAVTDADLSNAVSRLTGAVCSKVSDISLIFSTYDGLLSGKFSDPLNDLVKLEESLNTVGYFKDRTVVIDAFKGFTEQQYRIISHILRQAKEIYITVCSDTLSDNDDSIGVFSNNKATAAYILQLAHSANIPVAAPITVNNDYRFNGTVLRSVESILRGGDAVDTVGGEITVCACSNCYDEADYVARTIRRLVRLEGYRYRDFAVIARDMSSYRNMLCDAFGRYGVACFSDMRADADSLALFKFAATALHCAAFGYNSELMLQYVKSIVGGFTVEESALIDNYVLMWSIKGSEWQDDWTRNPDGLEEQFDKAKLLRINKLRERAIAPLNKLSESLKSGQVRTICRSIYDMLISTGVNKNLAAYSESFEKSGDYYSANIHRQSWDALMECLDNAVRVFDSESCDKREFCDLFDVLLSSCDIGSIPDRLDEVVIGSADRMRAGNPRITFIIGANYSTFPKPIGRNGLLSLSERRSVINAGIAIPDFERNSSVDEQFYIYSSLCTPSERLYITYHTSSIKGGKGIQAEFIGKISDKLPEIKRTVSSASEADRFEGVLPSVELVSTEKYRPYAESLKLQLNERGLAEGAISLDGTTADNAFISPENARRLFGDNIRMSASKAERYAHCPFSFFCEFGIEAKTVKSAELDVMRRGTLVHYVLEKAVRNHGRGIADMSREQRMTEISALLKEYSDKTLGGYDSLDKSFLFLLDRIALLLDRLVARIGDEMNNSDFIPDRFELQIGGDEIGAINIPLENGSVNLTGFVDRVDVFNADGKTYVRVVDYKTGSKKFDLSDVFYGLNMQMLIYLFAVVSGDMYENPVPAGVLYMPSKRPIHAADRSLNDSALSKLDDAELRMNGLLLNDAESLEAMEHGGNGRFIPYFPHNGRAVSWIADSDAFEKLKEEINGLLKSIGESIHSGKMCATPLDSTAIDACKYCDYKSVCLSDPEAPHDSVEKLRLNDAITKLCGGDEDGV